MLHSILTLFAAAVFLAFAGVRWILRSEKPDANGDAFGYWTLSMAMIVLTIAALAATVAGLVTWNLLAVAFGAATVIWAVVTYVEYLLLALVGLLAAGLGLLSDHHDRERHGRDH